MVDNKNINDRKYVDDLSTQRERQMRHMSNGEYQKIMVQSRVQACSCTFSNMCAMENIEAMTKKTKEGKSLSFF